MIAPIELDLTTAGLPPTLKRFARSNSMVRCIVGPVGSAKSTTCIKEIGRRGLGQRRGRDGKRHTRFAIIRNTYGQLRDTTRKTFEQWMPTLIGRWHEQSFTFRMLFDDVDCEVLFRALDRPEDVRKLLSLELTGAYINEAREIPKNVLDVLEQRVGRYPSVADGGCTWRGIWMDTNPWHVGHWGSKLFAKLSKADGYELFRQPGGRSPSAENTENLEPGYYDRLIIGKDKEWVRVYVDGEDASGDVGAIWGAWISDLEKRGGVCAFDHPTSDVITTWDLGHADSTGIWFWRVNANRQADLIDHYENTGQGLSHYFGVIDGKGYQYARHWLPHDARAKTLATQQTVVEQCAARWGAGKVGIVPDIGLDDGIDAARWLLEQPIRIHERCNVAGRLNYSGLDALREYRFEWDEDAQCFSRTPLHNWASHTADAFRYLAVVFKRVVQGTATPKSEPKGGYVVPVRPTIDELFENAPAPSGRI